ncbi:clathrin interactor EPSIN 1-like [Iris pallida]|uniref:Clathrin interactor EPSIN 1-like n=1 Tax=Iris pallida TaxID=29817 RepID=A0AAX6GMQ2_IRIPA|nr:clathrin interactor EPSIN 1-like [Iris pallida]
MSVLRLKEALKVCSRVSGWPPRLRCRLAASRRGGHAARDRPVPLFSRFQSGVRAVDIE